MTAIKKTLAQSWVLIAALCLLSGHPASANEPLCKPDLTDDDAPAAYSKREARQDFIKATIYANMRFPQIPTGISLGAMAYYFANPVPLQDIVKSPSRREVARFAEGMNRAHQAFGVHHATQNFKTDYATQLVTWDRIGSIAENGAYGLVDSIIYTIELCYPDNPIQASLDRYKGDLTHRSTPSTMKKINGLLMNSDDSEGMARLRQFTAVLMEVAKSPEYMKLSKAYRETLSYQEAVDRGESPEEPEVLLNRRQAARAITKLIRAQVIDVIPGISRSAFRNWTTKGLRSRN